MELGRAVLSAVPDVLGNRSAIADRICGTRRIQMPSKRCEPGCTCALHSPRPCPPGCTCGRHSGNTWRGRSHSDETKARISAAKKGQRRPCPENCTCGRHSAQQPRRTRPEDPEALREHKRAVFRDWYARNPRSKEEVRRQHLAHRHGLTPDGYQAMWDAQDGRCCYCERPLPEDTKKVHIDHDHSCTCGPKNTCASCRRGLACDTCNQIIGKADEDFARLERIAVNGRRLKVAAQARINTKPVQGELPIDIKRAARRREESA
jgi:Recombination endonuclease VII/NUMOD3 motif